MDAATQHLVYLTRGVTTRRGAGTGAPAAYTPAPDPDAEEEGSTPDEERPTSPAITPEEPPRRGEGTGDEPAPPGGK